MDGPEHFHGLRGVHPSTLEERSVAAQAKVLAVGRHGLYSGDPLCFGNRNVEKQRRQAGWEWPPERGYRRLKMPDGERRFLSKVSRWSDMVGLDVPQAR